MSAPSCSAQSAAHPGKTSIPVFPPDHPFLGRPSFPRPPFPDAQTGPAQFSSTDIRLKYKYNPHRAAAPVAGPVYMGLVGRQSQQKDGKKLGEPIVEKLGGSKLVGTVSQTGREKSRLVAEGLKFLKEHKKMTEEEQLKRGETEVIDSSSVHTVPKCNVKEACPSWLDVACETDSEEEGQETRKCSGATIKMSTIVQEKSEKCKQTPQRLEEAMAVPPSGAITSTADDDGDIIPGESLIQGYILTECHSLTVELLDCPSVESLQPCALAALLCGFLNSGEEGAVYLGVRRSGEVRGLPLSKAGRQEIRTQVERVVTSLLCPRVPPAAVCLEFLPVQGEREQLYVARLRLRGGGMYYRVHNLGRAGLGEGAYCRRNPGPDFNVRVG